MSVMGKAKKEQFDPRVFTLLCHRGLHDGNTTENGLRAFQKARDPNLPFELDVHLTKDGHLLVCHDSELKRTTGKEGIIEEMDLGYIKQNYKLLDGEEVPSLLEVLAENDEQVPIVIELKPYQGNQKLLARALVNELSFIKDKKNINVISFDPRCLFPLKKSGYLRGLLVGRQRKYVFAFRRFFEFLCPDKSLLNDKVVRRYRAKGGVLDVWTLESEEEIKYCRERADILTFQLLPQDALERVRPKKKDDEDDA